MISTEQSVACWNCGQTPEDVHFCRHCQSLQPSATDFFTWFGLPEKLAIDRPDLERRFYELSRRLHPDRFFRRPERERQLSLDATALLNDAYRTLQDPVTRAEYLLHLHGLDKTEQKSSHVPPELLDEVFELNLALEEMRAGDQSARPQLEQARSRYQAMIEDFHRSLEAASAAWDQTGRREALQTIYGLLNRRNYLRNLLRDVNAALTPSTEHLTPST